MQDIGYSTWVLGDGAYVDDYYHDGDKMDLYLYSTMGAYDTLGNFETIRIATRSGDTVPLADVASIDFTYGLERIRRVDNQRAVTLRITPPGNISLEEAIEIVRTGIIGAMQSEGLVPPGYTMRISGTSDKLSAIRAKLSSDFLLALMLTYLTMVLVFRHWGYPLTVMLSVPIGLTGGVLGLWVLNSYLGIVSPGTIQSLDVLTMLGFVILLGSVINNPILIVQQAINFMRQGSGRPPGYCGVNAYPHTAYHDDDWYHYLWPHAVGAESRRRQRAVPRPRHGHVSVASYWVPSRPSSSYRQSCRSCLTSRACCGDRAISRLLPPRRGRRFPAKPAATRLRAPLAIPVRVRPLSSGSFFRSQRDEQGRRP